MAARAVNSCGRGSSSRWRGNVRELENAIERACVTSSDGLVRLENLPAEIAQPPQQAETPAIDMTRNLSSLLQEAAVRIETEYISTALRQVQGKIGQCAKLAGMSRRSLSKIMAAYGINGAVFRRRPNHLNENLFRPTTRTVDTLNRPGAWKTRLDARAEPCGSAEVRRLVPSRNSPRNSQNAVIRIRHSICSKTAGARRKAVKRELIDKNATCTAPQMVWASATRRATLGQMM